MAEAVVVSTARTPIGKAYRGAFNNTHGATMAGHVIEQAVKRAKIDPEEVEDVILGCAMPEGATGGNIARQAALRAGLPVTTAAATINRFCSSGLQAISTAAHRVTVDGVPVAWAGGLESISLVQNENQNGFRTHEDWLNENKPELYLPMVDTAEVVGKRYNITAYRVSSVLRPDNKQAVSTMKSYLSRLRKWRSIRKRGRVGKRKLHLKKMRAIAQVPPWKGLQDSSLCVAKGTA